MHIHILGVCGTFMGGIAAIARAMGHQVSGSDANVYPPMSTQLQALGIEIGALDDVSQLQPQPDLVIVGNALSRGNPQVEAVLNQRIPYTSGPQWLGEQVLRHKWVLAVAGTHGKTTTASMLAHILHCNDLNPGFLIGGVVQGFDTSARLTDSPFFIIEADEYDTAFFDKRSKFVHYHPNTLALNNLEFDHADIFDDLDAIKRQFHHLVRTVPSEGAIMVPADDSALADVLAQGCWSEVQSLNADAHWQLQHVAADGSAFEVLWQGRLQGRVEWDLLGAHNVQNGLTAIACAQHAGVPAAQGCQALASFRAPKRRLECIAQHAQVRVYDDFAHHPTAMRTTLQGMRAHSKDTPLFAVIEPGSNTMRAGVHNAQLVQALALADQVFALDNGRLQWSLADLAASASASWTVSDSAEGLASAIMQALPARCEVVLMSNGSFAGLRDILKDQLAARFAAAQA